ncbi:hypothetical protein [Opitutus terrae]|uniref:Uncharacterized protein n=1 Tax=Opitutus terrae (strain DSM 11246 / JCM 15787 / PB90-1) TaxID=452637 RepID=B1ZY16_OPITP|nr:hypothetical protein [Opitutus terrae]ACB75215.1 conserved hypothetical protein [Opitutus terrae PB90-1]
MQQKFTTLLALLFLLPLTSVNAELSRRIPIRDPLAADRTYFVRPDGDDANSGLIDDATGAFRTIQKAVNVVSEDLDLGEFDVTIQIADGVYTSGVWLRPWLSSGSEVVLRGNVASPSSVLIDLTTPGETGGCCFYSGGGRQVWRIEGVKMQTSAPGGACIKADYSEVVFSNVVFGAATDFHVFAANHGKVFAAGSYSIVGPAKRHLYAIQSVILLSPAATVSLVGTPSFAWHFAASESCGVIDVTGVSFSGPATGARYYVTLNGVIKAFGTILPGNAAGIADFGGQYR